MKLLPRNIRAFAVMLAYAIFVVGVLVVVPQSCYELVVASSQEKADLLIDIAKDYKAPAVNRRCVTVTVTRKASGEAEAALARGWDERSDGPEPHVWSPAAETWVLLLRQHLEAADRPNLVPPTSQSLMQSPTVIGVPRPITDVLGSDLGWASMLEFARDPAAWARVSRPEWGTFGLGKTNPNVSTSGLHALVATYQAAKGGTVPPTRSDIVRAQTQEFVRGVESGVLHYADSVGTFLKNLYERDQRGDALKYVSALPMEEKHLFDYNRGNPESKYPAAGLRRPNVPLVAVYPTEGTLKADHPYVVLNGIEEPYRQAAQDFFDHLTGPKIQDRFCAEGFRDYHGNVCTPLPEPGIDTNRPGSFLRPPSETGVLAQMQRSWTDLRKKAQVHLVFDIGRTMGDFLQSAGETKLELAKDAAIAALRRNQLAPDDEVGLWVFSTNLDGERAYRQVLPLLRVDVGMGQLIESIRALKPVSGGKGLYSTLLAATFDIRSHGKTDRIRAVVVLTDGRNDDPRNNDRAGLLSTLKDQSDDLRVRVFTIAYGGADDALLKDIARESGGLFYDATDPANITNVFRDVISNF